MGSVLRKDNCGKVARQQMESRVARNIEERRDSMRGGVHVANVRDVFHKESDTVIAKKLNSHRNRKMVNLEQGHRKSCIREQELEIQKKERGN